MNRPSYGTNQLIVTNTTEQQRKKQKQEDYGILNLPKLPSMALFIIKKSVFIEHGNNSKLVKNFFESNLRNFKIQWGPLSENLDFDYDIKWINTYRLIDWSQYNPQKNIINKIHMLYQALCSKNGMLKTIRNYEAQMKRENKQIPYKMDDYIPETYMLNYKKKHLSNDEKLFLLCDSKKGAMLLKPCHGHQGKGIELVMNIEQAKCELKNQKKYMEEDENYNGGETHVIQRYIKPLLLDGNKFDVRVFILVASVKPLLVLYHPGYCRRTIFAYQDIQDNSASSKMAHLTNQGVQRSHPDFQKHKENTIWSWTKVENQLMAEGISQQQLKQMHEKTKKILRHLFQIGLKDVSKQPGQFELLGGDIIFDQNLNPYCLEINSNPALTIDTRMQNIVKPAVVNGTLKIVLKLNHEREKITKLLKNKMVDFYPYTELINEAWEQEEKVRRQKLLKQQTMEASQQQQQQPNQQQPVSNNGLPKRPQTKQEKRTSGFYNQNISAKQNQEINLIGKEIIRHNGIQKNMSIVAKGISRPSTSQEAGQRMVKHAQNLKDAFISAKKQRKSSNRDSSTSQLSTSTQATSNVQNKVSSQSQNSLNSNKLKQQDKRKIIYSNLVNDENEKEDDGKQFCELNLKNFDTMDRQKPYIQDSKVTKSQQSQNFSKDKQRQSSKGVDNKIEDQINKINENSSQKNNLNKDEIKKQAKMVQNFTVDNSSTGKQNGNLKKQTSQNGITERKSLVEPNVLQESQNTQKSQQQISRQKSISQQNNGSLKKQVVVKKQQSFQAFEKNLKFRIQKNIQQQGNQILRSFILNEENEGQPFVSQENFEVIMAMYADFTSSELNYIIHNLTHRTLSDLINYRYFMGQFQSKYYEELDTLYSINCKELTQEAFSNIANVVNQDKIRISQAFKSFEPNSQGVISLQKFRQILKNMSFQFSDEEVDGIFIQVDQDRDYGISFKEFKKTIEQYSDTLIQNGENINSSNSPRIKETLQKNGSTKQLNNNFVLDQNVNGNKKDEIIENNSSIIDQNGRKFQKNNIHNIIKKQQLKEDSINQAIQMAQEIFGKISEVLRYENISINDAFLSMDLDRDNKLSVIDLFQSFNMMSLQFTEQQIQSMMSVIDRDRDGYLSQQEFFNALQV